MDSRTNTIAGWVLAGCVAALGLTIVSEMVFEAERPEKMGYPIAGVEASGEAGAEAEVPIATLLASADVAAGEATFQKCASCHSINAGGANGIGPNLHGILGKPHAAVAGFAYSDALKAVGGTWDFDAMNAWLTSPRKYASGTKMSFAGLSDPQERANVIAYLNAQGSNLPLPAAPAAAEPATEAEANVAEAGSTELEDDAVPQAGIPSVDPAAAEKAAEVE